MFDESSLVIIEPCESTTCTQNLVTGNLRRMKLKQELMSALRGCCHILSTLISCISKTKRACRLSVLPNSCVCVFSVGLMDIVHGLTKVSKT